MKDATARSQYLDEVIALLYPPSARTSARTLLPNRLLPRRLVPRQWWHVGGRVMVPDGPETIETYLSDALGQRVRVIVHLRPARRANRKPVLEVRGAGGLVGFAKAGDLAKHEAEVLGTLDRAALTTVVAPRVLHYGDFRGLGVLVLTPLPITSRKVPADTVAAAAAEIARLGDGGSWHGDFSPWNMALAPDGRLLVWGWERFSGGVPAGFDLLHYDFQLALRKMRPKTAASALIAGAGRTLAPFGLSSAPARLTAAHYLMTIADRFDAEGVAPLGPSAEWLNPALDGLEVLI